MGVDEVRKRATIQQNCKIIRYITPTSVAGYLSCLNLGRWLFEKGIWRSSGGLCVCEGGRGKGCAGAWQGVHRVSVDVKGEVVLSFVLLKSMISPFVLEVLRAVVSTHPDRCSTSCLCVDSQIHPAAVRFQPWPPVRIQPFYQWGREWSNMSSSSTLGGDMYL